MHPEDASPDPVQRPPADPAATERPSAPPALPWAEAGARAADLSPTLLHSVVWLLGSALVVAMLYFGRDIFVPFALAALLAFVLDPLVTRLRHWRLPRPLAVGLVLACTVALVSWVSVFVAGQTVELGRDLPTYQDTVQKKLRSLRQHLSGRSMLDDASRMLEVVGGELDATRRALDPSLHGGKAPAAPMKVEVQPAARTAVQAIGDLVAQVLGPVATAGLVLVFLVFILLERHDLRDRLLRLVGGELHRTTDALDEAAQRVSRYLTMQLLVNTGYAVPLAAGLWAIGVPGALLWGALGGLLRFAPYVGPLIAAVFPLTLAFAVDPGWQMLLWTAGLIALLELVINNLVEPWLYGHSTGLAPTAVLLAAAFWTALWGPIGLLLATPITVCLVVMGRHLPRLAFLDLMLGRDPVFDPATRLHQRLLAGDTEEAIEMALAQSRAASPQTFYNDTALPMLLQAAAHHRQGASAAHRHRLLQGMHTVLAELQQEHPHAAAPAQPPSLLCIGGRWEVDALAAGMLAHALQLRGTAAQWRPATAAAAEHIGQLPLDGVHAVCLAYFSPMPAAHARYACRRLRRLRPELRIVLALWNAPPELLLPGAAAELGADAVATSLDEAVLRLQGLLPQAAAPAPAAPSASAEEDARLRALQASGALNPAMRAPFDHAAQRAADVFDMPMAMVSLIDSQSQRWLGHSGLPADTGTGTPERTLRDTALCSQVVDHNQAVQIPDTARDPRFAGHPALQAAGIRFHAGAPLRTAAGQAIGALCVLDRRPRQLGEPELRLLQAMADDLMRLLAEHQEQLSERDADAPSLARRALRAAWPGSTDTNSAGTANA